MVFVNGQIHLQMDDWGHSNFRPHPGPDYGPDGQEMADLEG